MAGRRSAFPKDPLPKLFDIRALPHLPYPRNPKHLHIQIRRQHYFDTDLLPALKGEVCRSFYQQPGFEITHHALMLIIAQSPEATN